MKKFVITMFCLMLMLGFNLTSNAASKYTVGKTVEGRLTEENESQVYTFTLDSSGSLDISVEADFEYFYIELFDEKGEKLFSHNQHWNSMLEMGTYQGTVELTKGKYHLSIDGIHRGFGGRWYGNYEFCLNFKSAEETFSEVQNGSDNTIKTANHILIGETYTGHLSLNDSKDLYAFTLPTSGKLSFHAEGTTEYLLFNIYDSEGKEVWSACEHWNSTMKYLDYSTEIELTKGMYYISFEGVHPGFSSGYVGKYMFDFGFESAKEYYDDEINGTNNDIQQASNIQLNKKYNGHLARNDSKDIYRFELKKTAKLKFASSGEVEYLYFNVFDSKGKNEWSKCVHWNGTTKQLDFECDIELESDVYYLSVEGVHPGFSSGYVGKYDFSISDGNAVSEVKASPNGISVLLNGKNIGFDQPPIIRDGRTLVPLRAIFEALGADVKWVDSTKTVNASKDDTKISLQIGSADMHVNNDVVVLDVPACIVNERTLVPVRAISEAFGCDVGWDDYTKTVILVDNN